MDWEGLGAVRHIVAEGLRQAAQEIRDRGWVQGRFVDDDGAVDVLQALGLATGLDVAASHTRELRLPAGSCVLLGALLEAARDGIGCEVLSIWNDLPDRTAREVEQKLEAVARGLDEHDQGEKEGT
jgi:hypothetical protein